MPSHPKADFRFFYEQTAEQIYAFAYLMAGDNGEDLAAEAFARALARWNDVAGYDRPDAWVRSVIVNLLVSHGRKEKVQRLFVQRSRRDVSIEDDAAHIENRLMLQQALRHLSPKQRAVIVLRYWNDLSLKETARAMGCSVSSANAHLSRARSKLQSLLGTAYIEGSAHVEPAVGSREASPRRASPRRSG